MSGPLGNSTTGSSVPGFSANGAGSPSTALPPFVVPAQDVQPAAAAVTNLDESERVIRRVPLQPLGHIDPDGTSSLVSEIIRNQHSQSQGQQQSNGQGQAGSEADDDYTMPELLDVSDSSEDDSEEGDDAADDDEHGSDGDNGSVPSLHDITDSSDEESEDAADETEDSEGDEDEDAHHAEAHDHADAIFRAILSPGDLPFPQVPTLMSLPSYRTRPDFLQRINQLLFETGEVNDPARAEELMRGLEPLSAELAARFVRAGGDAMCAVCREDLVPPEPESRTPLTSIPDLSSPLDADAARSPQAQYLDHRGPPLPFEQRTPPATSADALALPCRHAFHAACLHPWLSRRTTCPSCRLDLDPESLTLRLNRRRAAAPTLPADMSPMEQIRSLHSVSRDLDRVAEMLPRLEESMRNLTALANEGIAVANEMLPGEPGLASVPEHASVPPPPLASDMLRDLLGEVQLAPAPEATASPPAPPLTSEAGAPALAPPQPSEIGAPAPAPPQPSAIAGSLLDNDHLRFMLGASQPPPPSGLTPRFAPALPQQPASTRNPHGFFPLTSEAPATDRAFRFGPPSGLGARPLSRSESSAPWPLLGPPVLSRTGRPVDLGPGPSDRPSGREITVFTRRAAPPAPPAQVPTAAADARQDVPGATTGGNLADVHDLATRNDRSLDALEASVRSLRAALASTDRVARAVQHPRFGQAAAGPSTAESAPSPPAASASSSAPPPIVDPTPLAVPAEGEPALAQPASDSVPPASDSVPPASDSVPPASDSAQPPVVRYAWPPAIDPTTPAAPRASNPLQETLARHQLLQTRLLELRDDPSRGPDDLLAALRDRGPIRSAPVDIAPGLPFALATSPAARDAELDAINAERIAIENQLRAARRMQEGLLARRGPSAPVSPSGSAPAATVSFDLPTSPAEYRPTGDAQLDALHAERANIENQLQAARRMQHGLLERLQEQHNVLAARAALLAPSLRPAPPGFIRVHEPPRRHNGDTVVAPANVDAVDAPVNGDVLDAGAPPPPLEQVEPTPHRRRWVCPAPKGGLSLRAWIEEREQAVAEGGQAEGSSSGLTLEVPRPRQE